jgi:hypothetical protein
MVGLGETNFPLFALALGKGDAVAGLVATVPQLVGAVLQTCAPWAIERIGSPRRWIMLCATIQVLGFGDHELACAQLIGSPGLHQLAMAEHPDPGLLGGLGPFEAGQGQVWIGRREPGQFNLLQPLPRRFTYHQGQGLLPQGQWHQQADPPIGLRAWSQAYHGVIPAPQAAGDEPAQAEMVGPVPASLTLE